MKITRENYSKLANGLFDKMIELKKEGETSIKAYEVAFQDVIEEVFPEKCWWEVTECQIFWHLMEFQDPGETVQAILKGLKEDDDGMDGVIEILSNKWFLDCLVYNIPVSPSDVKDIVEELVSMKKEEE